MGKIIVIDGIDGTGKTTLAKALEAEIDLLTLGEVRIVHATYKPEWNMQEYHQNIVDQAKYVDFLIVDRLCASEYAYGEVYRDGASYNIFAFLLKMYMNHEVTWIYANHGDAVENFAKLKETRVEMYPDTQKMFKVQEKYNDFFRLYAVQFGMQIFDMTTWPEFDGQGNSPLETYASVIVEKINGTV